MNIRSQLKHQVLRSPFDFGVWLANTLTQLNQGKKPFPGSRLPDLPTAWPVLMVWRIEDPPTDAYFPEFAWQMFDEHIFDLLADTETT